MEGLTNILFTANGGTVFDLLMHLLKVIHATPTQVLQTNMAQFQEVKLADLKLDLPIEKIRLTPDLFNEDDKYTLFSKIVGKY